MPRVRTRFELCHRLLRRQARDRVLGSPRFEQAVEIRRRHVVVELEIVLQARRAIAGRQALDFFIGELAVRTCFAVGQAESPARVRFAARRRRGACTTSVRQIWMTCLPAGSLNSSYKKKRLTRLRPG